MTKQEIKKEILKEALNYLKNKKSLWWESLWNQWRRYEPHTSRGRLPIINGKNGRVIWRTIKGE